jgi:hypothetical protein
VGWLSRFRRRRAPRREKTLILEIPSLVRRLVPDLFKGSDLPSVICIRTTRPKYLVFNNDPQRPACIAQFGAKDELERLHKILSRLHGKEPDLFAEPLLLSPWRDNIYIHLQIGLPGMPWFRVTDRHRSHTDWARLGARAREALERLHTVIRCFPDWVRLLRPGDELRLQLRICKKSGVPLTNLVQDWVARIAERLDDLGDILSHWQHGDFCINNLLVGPSHVSIIDFEEFGQTAMPLHDHIGLELSFRDLAPLHSMASPPAACHPASLKYRDTFLTQQHLAGIYMHHLLWRINQSRGLPTRAQAKSGLLERVEETARCSGVLNALSAARLCSVK